MSQYEKLRTLVKTGVKFDVTNISGRKERSMAGV
jgi:hypothetical protein